MFRAAGVEVEVVASISLFIQDPTFCELRGAHLPAPVGVLFVVPSCLLSTKGKLSPC